MRAAAFALIAATASTVAARNDAHVYLHPAEPVPAVTARPEVVAQALSYHLDLPQTDPSVGPREAWAFSPPASPKSMLEDNRNRLVLYIDGVDEPQGTLFLHANLKKVQPDLPDVACGSIHVLTTHGLALA